MSPTSLHAQFIRIVGTPRLWFVAGVLAFVVGMALAYHDVQMQADKVIAMRETAVDGTIAAFSLTAERGVGAETMASWRRFMNGIGLLCLIASMLLSFSPKVPRRPRRAAEPETHRAVSRHRSFAPIVSQDEIAEAEAEALVRSVLPASVARLLERPGQGDPGIASFRSRR